MVEGVKCPLALAPGWNLVGVPFERVTDAGTLFDHLVLRVGRAVTRLSAGDTLEGGQAYWVYNSAAETVTVTLTGTARVGGETDFPALEPSWNYVSPVGCYNRDTGAFDEATTMREMQWRWEAAGQFFCGQQQVPSIGSGYMVKE